MAAIIIPKWDDGDFGIYKDTYVKEIAFDKKSKTMVLNYNDRKMTSISVSLSNLINNDELEGHLSNYISSDQDLNVVTLEI